VEVATLAIDEVARALLGDPAVALLKVKNVARMLAAAEDKVVEKGCDLDCTGLLEDVQTRVLAMAAMSFNDAAQALDRDGDGDVDDTEFESAQAAYEACLRLLAAKSSGEAVLAVDGMAVALLDGEWLREMKAALIVNQLDAVAGWLPNCQVGEDVQQLLTLIRSTLHGPGDAFCSLHSLELLLQEAVASKGVALDVHAASEMFSNRQECDDTVQEVSLQKLQEEMEKEEEAFEASDRASLAVDRIAEALLGDETLAQFKIDAIAKAMTKCKANLGQLQMGDDVTMLFEIAVQALDADGDGTIDDEEMKAVKNAKGCVDRIIMTTRPRVAEFAVDQMAKVVIGEEALAKFKQEHVVAMLEECALLLRTLALDQDAMTLLQELHDKMAATETWALLQIAEAKQQVDCLLKSEGAAEAQEALDLMATALLGLERIGKIKLDNIDVAAEKACRRMVDLILPASRHIIEEVQVSCHNGAGTDIAISQLTRTKGHIQSLHPADLEAQFAILIVINLSFEIIGDERMHQGKLEVFEPVLEQCRQQMVTHGCTETELRQLINVKAAGYRDMPLLESNWALVRVLACSSNNQEASAAFEDLALAILGDHHTRRAPTTVNTLRRAAPPPRKALGAVISQMSTIQAFGGIPSS